MRQQKSHCRDGGCRALTRSPFKVNVHPVQAEVSHKTLDSRHVELVPVGVSSPADRNEHLRGGAEGSELTVVTAVISASDAGTRRCWQGSSACTARASGGNGPRRGGSVAAACRGMPCPRAWRLHCRCPWPPTVRCLAGATPTPLALVRGWRFFSSAMAPFTMAGSDEKERPVPAHDLGGRSGGGEGGGGGARARVR